MFNKQKDKYNNDLRAIILLIEEDIKEAVVQEMVLFKRNPDNKNFEQSAIANIALLNLPAIETENGYEQVINLFEDHYEQMVGRRLNQTLHTLYIRYGTAVINEVAERSLTGMEQVYNINESILHNLYEEIPAFWMQPFIRKAYFDVVNDLATAEK